MPTTPRERDPSARNLCHTIWRCVLSRCFTVTLTANPHLRARAGSHRASSQAYFTPTPPLRLQCEQPGLQPQRPPPTPDARPLHPQGAALKTGGLPVFRSGFFCSAFLAVTLTRPLQRGCLAAPSEEHFHGQAPPARPDFVKGDGQKTHSRAEKKRP